MNKKQLTIDMVVTLTLGTAVVLGLLGFVGVVLWTARAFNDPTIYLVATATLAFVGYIAYITAMDVREDVHERRRLDTREALRCLGSYEGNYRLPLCDFCGDPVAVRGMWVTDHLGARKVIHTDCQDGFYIRDDRRADDYLRSLPDFDRLTFGGTNWVEIPLRPLDLPVNPYSAGPYQS